MGKKMIFRGAAILTAAGIIVKCMGAVNRIFLSRLLGGEGIGLYQMAYPVYQTAISVATAGLPVAISILAAEKIAKGDFGGVRKVFWQSFVLTALLGLAASLGLYVLAGFFIANGIVRDERAYLSIAALSPAIFFVAILAAFRGFFQGFQNMKPPAVSQILEQGVRVASMLAAAVFFLPLGIEYGAAGASFGAAAGAFAAAIYLGWLSLKQLSSLKKGRGKEKSHQIFFRLLKLAVPVSLANLMLPITASIDLFVVPFRLEAAGYTVAAATELYGYLTGMAASLISLPTILTAAMAASIVPAVSEAVAKGDLLRLKKEAAEIFSLTALAMFPCAAGLYFLAYPIAKLLYGSFGAGGCIEVMAAGVVFLGFGQVSTGILQGMGHTLLPFINMAIAAAGKFIVGWHLTALPEWGITGAAWATVIDFAVAAALNCVCVAYCLGKSFALTHIARYALLAAAMGCSAKIIFALLSNQINYNLAAGAAIICGAFIYGAMLLLAGDGKKIRAVYNN
jgi:stage V sporulation protein B